MARKNRHGDYENFVPYEKSGKKERRRRDEKQRNAWDFNPSTRVVPNKKKKEKRKRDNYYDDDYDEMYD